MQICLYHVRLQLLKLTGQFDLFDVGQTLGFGHSKKEKDGGLLALDYLYNIPGNPGAHKGFRGSCNRTLRCLAPVVGWWGARILKLTVDNKLFLNITGRYT